MFELADYLVGIYKVEDCTQSLTIQNYDKQRVLCIGEKENQSENFVYDGNISPTVPKQNTSPFSQLRDTAASSPVMSMHPINSTMSQAPMNSPMNS